MARHPPLGREYRPRAGLRHADTTAAEGGQAPSAGADAQPPASVATFAVPIRGRQMSNILDLGGGHRFTFIANLTTGERIGGVHDHPWHDGPGPNGEMTCSGFVSFRGRSEREPLWDVLSEEPLTLSPSLLCRICGSHGWIRNGRWEEA